MTHVKIHKHHFWTLIFSCLLFIGITIHQTVADNQNLTMGGSLNDKSTYSEEVNIGQYEELELSSANEYSDKIMEKKGIFKKKLNQILSDKIDTLSNEKLIEVEGKINVFLEKVVKNSEMKQEKKEKIISQLLALQELIQEKINYNEEFSLEIDLEELFSV